VRSKFSSVCSSYGLYACAHEDILEGTLVPVASNADLLKRFKSRASMVHTLGTLNGGEPIQIGVSSEGDQFN